jgi:exopolysaccharide biosynthesis protein
MFGPMLRVALLLGALGGTAAATPMLTFSADPHPGIHRETWVESAVPWRARLIQIDLTSAEIAVYATKESDKGLTTSAYATKLAAQVAINGDSFDVAGFVPRGLAIGASDPWANAGADDATSAVFHLQRVGERTVAAIAAPQLITTPDTLPEGTEGAVSGRPVLVWSGMVSTQFDCNDDITLACVRAPRTAVALSADGNTMWFAVVDGWQTGSTGMTAAELAQFLKDHGAYVALALDGGASSTLVVDDSVVSSPSDGVERPVANHLAVKYGSLPKGQLVGLICKHDVIGCTDDPTRKMSNVKVYLDDGRLQVTDSTALYDFTQVTQRYACVTAKKTGFVTKTQCAQVDGNGITYNSIAMWEGVDTPDAGVVDAGVEDEPDAGIPGGTHGDGGNHDMGPPGGGCCDTGRDDPPPLWLLGMVAWWLARRRGTV